MLTGGEPWTERSCPICSSSSADILANLPPRAFCEVNFAYRKDAASLLGLPNDVSFPIVRCNNCGFVYSKFLLRPELLDLVYEEVIDPDKCLAYSTSLPVVKQNVRIWYALLSVLPLDIREVESIRVLDYGAGWGTFLRVAKSPKVEACGYETSPKRLDYMQKHNIMALKASQEVEDAGPYHLICCNQVLEHVPSPIETLNLINRLMSDEAVGYFCVPNYKEETLQGQLFALRNGRPIPKELNPWEHLNYFTPYSFRYLISKCNFDIVPFPELIPRRRRNRSLSCMLGYVIRTELGILKQTLGIPPGRNVGGTEVLVRKKTRHENS